MGLGWRHTQMGGPLALGRGLWAAVNCTSGEIRRSWSHPWSHLGMWGLITETQLIWLELEGACLCSFNQNFQLDPGYKEGDWFPLFILLCHSISSHLFSLMAPPQASCPIEKRLFFKSLSGWAWAGSEEVTDQFPKLFRWCISQSWNHWVTPPHKDFTPNGGSWRQ